LTELLFWLSLTIGFVKGLIVCTSYCLTGRGFVRTKGGGIGPVASGLFFGKG
jgi:hypothetical protein